MSKLNILIFVENFSPPTETFVYNQVIGLAAEHNVWVACLKRINEDTFPYLKVKELPHHKPFLKTKTKNLLRRLDLYLNFQNTDLQKKLEEFVATFQPDLIHCHFGLQALILLDNLRQARDFPIFITFHGYDASKLLFDSTAYCQRLRQVLAQKKVTSLFVAEALHQNLLKKEIYPNLAKVVYLGVDTAFFKRIHYQKNTPFTFLQISSFTEKKGHEYTLKAFQLFLRSNPSFAGRLVLAGEGPLLASIKAMAIDLDIQRFIVFPGLVGREEVKEWMEKADVFLHHSITAKDQNTEGIPTVIMEAMAMELPILSTFHSGIPELVQDQLHGYLMQEKDITAYADKMQQIQSWSYRKENRATIIDGFSKKTHLKQLFKIYEKNLS